MFCLCYYYCFFGIFVSVCQVKLLATLINKLFLNFKGFPSCPPDLRTPGAAHLASHQVVMNSSAKLRDEVNLTSQQVTMHLNALPKKLYLESSLDLATPVAPFLQACSEPPFCGFDLSDVYTHVYYLLQVSFEILSWQSSGIARRRRMISTYFPSRAPSIAFSL